MKEFKKKIDEAVSFIESCWDENNPGDGKTFDERVEDRMNDIEDEEVRNIVLNAMI